MGRLSGTSNNASTTCTSDMGTGGPDHIYTLEVTTTTGIEVIATATFGVSLAARPVCDDALSEIGCARTDMGGAPDTAQLRGVLEPGIYYILVDTLGFGVGGDYTLTVSEFTPPTHTSCATAMSATVGSTLPSEDLSSAAASDSVCGDPAGNALFYSVVIPAGSGLNVATQPAADPGPLPGPPPTVEIIDGCDSSMCLNRGSSYANTTGADQTVVVAMRGTGIHEVSFEAFRVAENASCASALSVMDGTALTGERLSFGGSNPSGCFTGLGADTAFQSLFYTVDVPAGQLLGVRAGSPGAFEPIVVSLLDGCAAGAMCLASGGAHPPMPGTEGVQEVFYENTGAATATVVIAVSGPMASAFDLAVSVQAAPVNTSCAMATAVSDGTRLPVEFVGTATDTLETACLTTATAPVVYYSATVGIGETLIAQARLASGFGSTSVVSSRPVPRPAASPTVPARRATPTSAL